MHDLHVCKHVEAIVVELDAGSYRCFVDDDLGLELALLVNGVTLVSDEERAYKDVAVRALTQAACSSHTRSSCRSLEPWRKLELDVGSLSAAIETGKAARGAVSMVVSDLGRPLAKLSSATGDVSTLTQPKVVRAMNERI